VNFQVDAAKVELLVHLVPDPRRSLIGIKELAVNRDPLIEPAGIHHHLPYPRRRHGDVGRR
jgi:hypothetical protein